MASLGKVRAILFDAYGTLFRLDSIESACAAALADRGANTPTAAELATLWRAKQLEYSVHRSMMGRDRYVDFATVTTEALDYGLDRFGIELSPKERSRLFNAWRTPGADPEAKPMLDAFAPLPRAILSNGEPGMLAAAVEAAGLTEHLDAVLSVDEVGVYKPHPDVYALGTARYRCNPEEIGFVSANGWDAAGAAVFGFRVCWVNRLGLPVERHGPRPEAIVRSLAEVPAAFGR
jgi:2-haloacid dehalogenase